MIIPYTVAVKRSLVLLVLAASALAQTSVDSMIAAERAFAKRSHDTNMREAFLAYSRMKALSSILGLTKVKAALRSDTTSPSDTK